MAKKSQGLDKHKMEIVLRKLAMFHAASAVSYESNGPYGDKFSRGVYNPDMKYVFGSYYDNFMFVVENFLTTWTNLDKGIVDKIVSSSFSFSRTFHGHSFIC